MKQLKKKALSLGLMLVLLAPGGWGGMTVRATDDGFVVEDGVLTKYTGNEEEVTIPDSVSWIGSSAFWGCRGVKRVIIPDSVKTIGDEAFRGSGLTQITIGNGVTKIGDYAFDNCDSLTSVTLPDSVRSMGGRVFGECDKLQQVTLGNSLTSVSGGAFYQCYRLEQVTVGEAVTSIETNAFYCCTSLQEVTLPDSLTTINDYAFYHCDALTSVTFGQSLEAIGYYAFGRCGKVTSVDFPDSLTTLYGDAFLECTSLTGDLSLNSVSFIGDRVFKGCKSLKSVTVGVNDQLRNVKIGDSAFSGCKGLQSVTVGQAVSRFNHAAFSDCTSLTRVTISDSVTSIGASAFCNCVSLTGVTIPDSVTSVEGAAFSGCTSLTSVIIPESVTLLGASVFSGCKNLTSVTIPDSVTSLGTSAFSGCTALTSVTIPNSVTSLGASAFSGCTALTSVTIPDSVTSMGEWVFYGCTALTSVKLSGSVTSIGYCAFTNCKGLTGVTFPDSVTAIGGEAFRSCTNLTHITVPNSVTSIGNTAFKDCYRLEKVTFIGTPEQWNALAENTDLIYLSVEFQMPPKTLTSIDMREMPAKIIYTVGEAFDPAEMKLQATYSDNTTAEITSGFTYTPTGKLTTAGQQKIVVSYGGKETSFYVTVNPASPEVSSVTIAKKPTKQTYTVGESFNTSGMKLKVTYTDGSTKEVTSGFTYTPTGKLNTAGQQKIVVSYGGKTTGFYVAVNQAVSSVTIAKKPTKQTYTVGESFNTSGMKLKVTYTDNTTSEITSGFTYTPTGKLNTAGQQKIVVSYGGKSTGFYVTVVKAISSVTIAKKPTKQTYTVGESFNAAGMKLKVTYADNTTAEITSGFTYTPTGKLNTAGQQKIVVSYGGKSTGFYVTVNASEKAVSSVTIAKKPTKQTYNVGEAFAPAGMKLKVTYADNATAEITSGFTYTPTGKLNTAGQQKIVVSYGGKSTGFYVTVNQASKTVSAVTIAKKPTKQTYNVGEFFDASGMKLKVTYTDNSTAEITNGFTFTPSGQLNTAGQQKIVVSYGGKSTGFYVTVNKVVSSVTIAKKPTKQTYNVGEFFNPSGMKLKVTYTDGSTAEITDGFTFTPSGQLNTAGQQKIVVSYGGKSTGFFVTVR